MQTHIHEVSLQAKQKILTILTILILLGAFSASLAGVWIPSEQKGTTGPTVTSIRGVEAVLDGKGLYRNETISYAAQARGQDYVTLAIGIPLLITGMLLAKRGSFRGKLLYTGSLGYMLYTFSSYAYLCAFNALFLLYTAIYSMSLISFLLSFSLIDTRAVAENLSPRFPRRFLGGYLLAMSVVLLLLWLGKIIPAVISSVPPVGLEVYTTLVIQAHDLALIVPSAAITGILLLKKNAWGITLAAVLFMKMLTMGLALFVMMGMMYLAGTAPALPEIIIFTILLSFGLVSAVLMLASVRTPA